MPIKSVKMKISKNKKIRFFLMSQGSLSPKIRFLGQKVCSVARVQRDTRTHRQTDRHTDRVTTEGTLSGFHDFFLQPIIKDRPKMHFFLMFQGSFNSPKDRFLGQKVCPVASEQTDTQTHTHTRKWIQRTPFQGFRNFSFNLSSRIDPITRIDTQHHYVNLVDYTAT